MNGLSGKVAHPDRFFINGRWAEPSGSGLLSVISPVTEEVIATVPEAAVGDINAAVAAAREAFDRGPWPRMSPAERSEILLAFAHQLSLRKDDFATIWSMEGGAALSMTQPGCALAAGLVEYYARMIVDLPFVDVRPSYAGSAIVVREPVGVVAAILPWNAPVPLSAAKFAPALAAGCTVVLKPAPETPVHAQLFGECAEAAGLPPGVLNIVAAGREGSQFLVQHRGVDKVSFTGSVATGRWIAMACAERFARFGLELGGKSAAIVLDDADVATTAATLAAQAAYHAGQVCFALTRVVVPAKRRNDYAEAIEDAFAKIHVGDPLDPGTGMGPLAMARQRERVEYYVQEGIAEGATLVAGGRRATNFDRGYFFEPTLFSNVRNDMRIAREEVFGPVLSLIDYTDVEDAIEIANASPYGLGGAVFTADVDQAYAIGRRIRTGSFGHNDLPVDFTAAPFGGFKESGVGREGGPEGLNSYFELKTVYMPKIPEALRGAAGR